MSITIEKIKEEEGARYVYEAVREVLISEELGKYVTYGIRCSRNLREIAFVSDVSADAADIELLVDLCNKEQLEPIHLYDVIEDHFADII